MEFDYFESEKKSVSRLDDDRNIIIFILVPMFFITSPKSGSLSEEYRVLSNRNVTRCIQVESKSQTSNNVRERPFCSNKIRGRIGRTKAFFGYNR